MPDLEFVYHVLIPSLSGILTGSIGVLATRRAGRREREEAIQKLVREQILVHGRECPLTDFVHEAIATRKREVAEQIATLRVETVGMVAQERQERSTLHQDMRDLRADVRSIREMLVEVAAGVKRMNGGSH